MNFINALFAWLVVFTICVVQIARSPEAPASTLAGIGVVMALAGWIGAIGCRDFD